MALEGRGASFRFGNRDRRAAGACVEDDDFRRFVPFVYAVMRGVDQFDDGITGFEMQRFSILRHDSELSAQQHACIYDRVEVGLEAGSGRDGDTQDGDLGLALRIGWQFVAVPACCAFGEFPDHGGAGVRVLLFLAWDATGLEEKQNGHGRKKELGVLFHGIALRWKQ